MGKPNIETINFFSKSLKKEMAINIYIPPFYNSSKCSYPVLYFLHGRSGNENIMFDLDIGNKVENLISAKKISPLIIVCPRIENSRGINSSDNCKDIICKNNITIQVGMYEDYLIKEVIPFIDNNYNTIDISSGRFIGGASAGGYAALHNAFRHPNLFSKVGGHMPAIDLALEDDDIPYFSDLSIWEKYNPISIAQLNNIPKSLKVYLDVGAQDEGCFYKGCEVLNSILIKNGINTQYHLFEGHHNIEYINSNMEKYLDFYAT